jgi:CRP-like cAMP-binding protein
MPVATRMITVISHPVLLAGVEPDSRLITAGTALFRQGDRSFGVFLLESGRVRLQRITPDGSIVSIHLARPGETFAEASLFSENYHCDAIAEVDSRVWLYPKGELSRRLRAKPDALWAFAGDLARLLQGLRLRYELKQIRSAAKRVHQFLRMRCEADGTFRVDGALKDVAAEVGLTQEAFYRTLAALEKQGRIARSAGAIRLIGRRD